MGPCPVCEPACRRGAHLCKGVAAGRESLRKRKGRLGLWWDSKVSLTEEEHSRAFKDPEKLSKITLNDSQLRAYYHLPHKKEGLPFTTITSDVCDSLAEPFRKAIGVGRRRREAKFRAGVPT